MNTAIFLKVGGTCEVVKIPKNADNAMEVIQNLVDGDFSLIPHAQDGDDKGAPLTAYANEDGMMMQLDKNKWQDWLVKRGFVKYGDLPYWGDIVLMGAVTKNGNDTSVPVRVIRELVGKQ